MRKLADWLDSYMTYTDNTEPRASFRKWCGVSAIAACLKRKCFLSLGREIFYPNFYIVLVGPPAARKGTAMKPAIELLDSLGIAKAADESSRQKLITKLKTCGNTEGDVEKSMITYHSSLTIISTELSVFLGYGQLELISTLCKWFDCETSFVYDTISRGEEYVTNVWVNLLGATTPTTLRSALPSDASGSGLTSRMIFVYEDNKAKIVIFPESNDNIRDDLLHDLQEIQMLSGQFKMTPEAFEAYAVFRHMTESNPPFNTPELLGYLDRRQVHLLKLSMVYSASRGSDMIVTVDDFNKALDLLKVTERNMPKVFQGIGQNPLASVQVRIMEFIATRGETSIPELIERFYNDISLPQLTDVVDALCRMKYCDIKVPGDKIIFNQDKLKGGVL